MRGHSALSRGGSNGNLKRRIILTELKVPRPPDQVVEDKCFMNEGVVYVYVEQKGWSL